jgi:hypothetical protein
MRISVVRTITISIIYALIEAYYPPINQGDVISPYHILVFLIGAIAGFDRNIYIWLANSLTYTILEDAFYWLFKLQLPFQWGKEYIVFHHIPIYYIPYSIIAIILYLVGLTKEKRNKKNQQ